ncbi:MAG: nuclear transport factor 2 family protein [Bacteroidota bacterium]
MNDTTAIQETVIKMFVNSDQRNWSGVEAQFASKVILDYASMTGNPAAAVTPTEITTGWKTVLPGFDSTHHQLGNILVEEKGTKAHVFCYGTATHYLENENGNIWTVVGSYDFDLEKIDNQWKILSMKFNFKYQDGNTTLVQKAIENVKNN